MDETPDMNEPSSTDAIRREIHGTEREMSDTIHEIRRRLSPQHVAEQTRDSMRRAGVNIIDKVKRNPIPLAMAGVGLWLFFRNTEGKIHDALPVDKIEEGVDSAREKIEGKIDRAKVKLEGGVDTAKEKMQGAMWKLRDVYDRQPLVAGVVGIAVGAVLAAVIPESQREDALLGDTRDRLLDQATAAARERVGKVKQAMKEEGQRMKEVVKEEGQRIMEAAEGRE